MFSGSLGKTCTMTQLLAILTSPNKGEAMRYHTSIKAIRGIGLEGDRYALGIGAHSKSKRIVIRHVSLIAIEAILEANKATAVAFTPDETRRNLVTMGVDVNTLIGKVFGMGHAVFKGVEWCDPCGRPSNLSGKPGFEEAYKERGGLRAEVLEGGIISVGNPIMVF